jgi:hypothetical protein
LSDRTRPSPVGEKTSMGTEIAAAAINASGRARRESISRGERDADMALPEGSVGAPLPSHASRVWAKRTKIGGRGARKIPEVRRHF